MGDPAEDVPWLDDDEQAAWRAYIDSTRMLLSALDHQLSADAGISLTDYELMLRLSEAPGRRLRMRDLADLTVSTRSGASRAVNRLEHAGWVRRVDCDDDRRGTLAELTGTGLAKLRSAAPGHVLAVRRHMIDLLTREELAGLEAVGRRILAPGPAETD